jgi:hypothetical protein
MKELHQVQKSDWTQFRGPTASGIASPHANPPTEFGEDKNLFELQVIFEIPVNQ